MDIIKTLKKDVNTDVFNDLKQEYRNDLLDFIEPNTSDSPIFDRLFLQNSKPLFS